LAWNAGVRQLELGRLAAEVVQRLGALNVTSHLGDLGVRDRVDDDSNKDAY